MNQTFISAEIQTIYKIVFIYQILGPRDWTLNQKYHQDDYCKEDMNLELNF